MDGPTADKPIGPGRFVTADDVRASFGSVAALREVGHDDPDASWMVFELVDGRFVEVFVNLFPVGPEDSAIEDEEAWRVSGVASEVADLGDAAFFNRDGALFARAGRRWSVQVLAGERGGEGAVMLARAILARLPV